MIYTILSALGVLFLLAFMSVSLVILYRLLTNYEELIKKAEEENKPISSVMNKMIWNTLRMRKELK